MVTRLHRAVGVRQIHLLRTALNRMYDLYPGQRDG